MQLEANRKIVKYISLEIITAIDLNEIANILTSIFAKNFNFSIQLQ